MFLAMLSATWCLLKGAAMGQTTHLHGLRRPYVHGIRPSCPIPARLREIRVQAQQTAPRPHQSRGIPTPHLMQADPALTPLIILNVKALITLLRQQSEAGPAEQTDHKGAAQIHRPRQEDHHADPGGDVGQLIRRRGQDCSGQHQIR